MKRNFHPSGDRHYSRQHPERVKRGVAANGAKLSAADRVTILHMSVAPVANHTRIARLFDVSRQTIWRVRKEA